jgi:peptidoglycan/xylan/chitin deacetylase (PgdA/CDA1 family)
MAPAPALDIVRASSDRREVLLTFDGGSNSNSTPVILDILKNHGIHATMFLTGEYIQRYPELVRRIAAEGHTVGNHTFSHPHLTSYSFNARQTTLPGVSSEFLRSQLSRTSGIFQLVTDRRLAPYWRAPFGEYNGAILKWGADAGWRHVYWSPHMDTLDWVSDPTDPLFRTPTQILTNLLRQARTGPAGMSGGIVLMHLGTEREGESRADTVLEGLVRQLEEDGYRFVSVDGAEIPR